ncbi:hypothetical protein SAMN02927924_02105 [Sphingobium faniae]|nr:hypothetical protein SAMN02927924_02105 [Sphingobium faniae]
MNLSKRILWSLAGITLASGQVMAQTEAPTGSHIHRPKPVEIVDSVKLTKSEIARRATNEFGQCVVMTSPKKVDVTVALGLKEPALTRSLKSLATPECLREGALKMPQELMLGSIFRAMYLRDFSKAQPPLLERGFDFKALVEDPNSPDGVAQILLRDFADCVVRADLEASRTLTMSTAGSAKEKSAFAMLIPKMGPCMPQGLTVNFSKDVLAALIAEVLYRNSRDAFAAASVGENQ